MDITPKTETGIVELLPCPFCGARVIRENGYGTDPSDTILHVAKPGGNNCPLADGFSNWNCDGDVSELWNTRAAMPDSTQLLQTMAGALEAGAVERPYVDPTSFGDDTAALMRAYYDKHRPRTFIELLFGRRSTATECADNLMLGLLNIALNRYENANLDPRVLPSFHQGIETTEARATLAQLRAQEQRS